MTKVTKNSHPGHKNKEISKYSTKTAGRSRSVHSHLVALRPSNANRPVMVTRTDQQENAVK
jgi:hypothetical protein